MKVRGGTFIENVKKVHDELKLLRNTVDTKIANTKHEEFVW